MQVLFGKSFRKAFEQIMKKNHLRIFNVPIIFKFAQLLNSAQFNSRKEINKKVENPQKIQFILNTVSETISMQKILLLKAFLVLFITSLACAQNVSTIKNVA